MAEKIDQSNLSKHETIQDQLSTKIDNLDNTPDKSKTLLANKLLQTNEFQDPAKISDIQKLIYKKASDWKWVEKDSQWKFIVKGTVFEEVFRQMPEKQAKALASYLSLPKTDKKYSQTIWFLNKEIDNFLKTAKNQEEIVGVKSTTETNKNENEKSLENLTKQIWQTKEKEQEAIKTHWLSPLPENLTAEEQAKFATETLQMTPTERTKLQTKLSNSEYKQAGLSESQILSFLYTEKQLDAKGIQNSEFAVNFNKIRDDLNIYKPLKNSAENGTNITEKPISVQTMNNLDNDSITALAQNNENLKAYSWLPKSPDTYRNLQIKKTTPLAFLQKKAYFCRKIITWKKWKS